MLDSIEIENFRGFQNASLDDLGRVNVIVGQNSSGKTALLEAIYLTLGAPELAFKLRLWRGLGGNIQVTGQPESKTALWRDLFFQFDEHKPASILFKGTDDIARKFKISGIRESGITIRPSKGKPSADIESAPPILFEWSKRGQPIGAAKPEVRDGALHISGAPPPLPGAFFSSASPVSPEETANWFSELRKKRKEEVIVLAMRGLFPFIDDLSVETFNGTPMVFVDVPTLSEKIPAGLVSSGVNKLLAMLVGIVQQAKGIIIVDEIENGVYYDLLPKMWKALYECCKEYEVQLFASTHSLECLRAAGSVSKGHENDFSLIRTGLENGRCIVHQSSGLNFRRAIEQHIEIR